MLRTLLAILMLAPVLGAGDRTLQKLRGTVKLVNAEQGWYGLVPDRDPGTRYAPEPPLPEAFRKDGLRVIFSGRLLPADDGTRRWGTPLKVTRMMVEPAKKPAKP
jgi:hypothetical protein